MNFKNTFKKVVAVVAAASMATMMLAGCNVQPNVEKEDIETGFQPITQSVEIDNETFSMTVNGYKYNNDSKLLTVNITATNESGHAVTINGVKEDGTLSYDSVTASVEAYADAITDLEKGKLTVHDTDDGLSIWKDTIPAKTAASDGVVTGNLYFHVDSEYKDWKAVTMIVNVVDNETNEDDKAEISNEGKLEFVINR